MQKGITLYCVKQQTEELCKIACAQNGHALQYVEQQTEELCKIACAQNGRALEYCNHINMECFALVSKDCLKDIYKFLSYHKQLRIHELAITRANWNVFVRGTRDMLCVDIYDHIKRFI